MPSLLHGAAILAITTIVSVSIAYAQTTSTEDTLISDLADPTNGLAKFLPDAICVEADPEDQVKVPSQMAPAAIVVGKAVIGRYACDLAAVRYGWKGWKLRNRLNLGYFKRSDLVKQFAENGLTPKKANIFAEKTLKYGRTRVAGAASLGLVVWGIVDTLYSLNKSEPRPGYDLLKACRSGSSACLSIQANSESLSASIDPALPITSSTIPECALPYPSTECKSYEALLTSDE